MNLLAMVMAEQGGGCGAYVAVRDKEVYGFGAVQNLDQQELKMRN